MLLIPLNPRSNKPLYLQIADHVVGLARGGQLQPDDRLPPSRILAEHLQVHRSTVVNAYEELKARGVLETRQGSGSYITGIVQEIVPMEPASFPTTLASRCDNEQVVAEIWRLNQADGLISLALGLPADELILIDTFEHARQHVLRRDGALALAIASPQGFLPLRRAIARDLARQGILVDAEDIIVTFGAQEAITLVTRTLAAHGDDALTEVPTFFGILSSLRHLGVNLYGFDLQTSGPDWSSLAQQITSMPRRPRFVYVTPDYQNPTGISWDLTERHRFLKWADENDLPIIEDATYRDLRFEGPVPPPLRALSPEVFYIGSFSKALIPGLRIGFVIASGRTRDHLVALKSVTSGSGESLGQRTLAEFLMSGGYDAHRERVSAVYRRRRDAMLDALERFFPSSYTWTCPHGGFYVWLNLPAPIAALDVFQRTLQHNIVVAPSPVFYPHGAIVPDSLRLCYARYPEDVLTYAMRQLAHILESLT
jgi:GntR family transcriptional regulator/MocR family aminotransferase